ncbi:MAG: PH domain-containing protein [Clostridiales bacterium]|nr:PH domain-containing protein [Clostridiales bacterium]
MKVFKFKYSKLTTAFIYIGLALAVAAFGVTLYTVIKGDVFSVENKIYPIISHGVMFLVSVLLFVILLSLIISSYYSVGNNILKTSFGIIKSKFKIDNIKSVMLDRKTNKLTVHFADNSFILIAVKPEWYEDFINELLKNNPNIEYTINSKQNSPDDDQPKK